MRPMEEYQVIFYEKENGEKPAAEFIRSTEKKMAARIVTDLKLLALEGPAAREPLSKHLEDVFLNCGQSREAILRGYFISSSLAKKSSSPMALSRRR